jgi:phosphate-selective porin
MDDFYLALRYLFEYSGWGLSLVQPFHNGRLELCGRFDRFETRYTTGSVTTIQENLTLGVNFRPGERIRLMLNYLIKNTKNASAPDLDDNILYLNFQFTFDSLLRG